MSHKCKEGPELNPNNPWQAKFAISVLLLRQDGRQGQGNPWKVGGQTEYAVSKEETLFQRR